MEGFCRACLVKYENHSELLQYTEKNRRLFVYCTGLQVKSTDVFPFQMCQACFLKMKMSCQFKKQCRVSDKRLNHFLSIKEVGDETDFSTYLQSNDGSLLFKFPLNGTSTPSIQKPKDDDNVSTSTSIRNFMTDFLRENEVPDTEAHIIRQMIEQEVDLLDESLDSHWLQDDISIASDFRFSPFSTPLAKKNSERLSNYSETKEDIKGKELSNGRENLLAAKRLLLNSISCSSSETQSSKSQENTDQETVLAAKQILLNIESSSNASHVESVVKEPMIDHESYIAKKRILLHSKSTERPKVQKGKDLETFLAAKRIVLSSKSDSSVNETVESTDETPAENLAAFDEKDTNQDYLLAHKGFYVENVDANEITFKIEEKDTNQDDLLAHKGFYVENVDANEITFKIEEKDTNQDDLLAHKGFHVENVDANMITFKLEDIGDASGKKDSIDKNIEKLLNTTNDEVISLSALLASPSSEAAPACINTIATPSVHQGLSGANTPSIENILFGEKLDDGQTIKEPELGTKELELCSKGNHELELSNKDIEADKNSVLGDFFNKATGEYIGELKKEEEEIFEEYKNPELDDLGLGKAQFDITDYSCKKCNVRYKGERGLKIHFSRKHNMKIISQRKKEVRVDEPCDQCGKIFRSRSNLSKHIKVMHLQPKSAQTCKLCSLEFTTEGRLKMHMQSHGVEKHKGDTRDNGKSQVCPICGHVSLKGGNFKIHMARHNKTYFFTCDPCGRGFYRKNDLKNHMNLHMNVKPFKCPECSERFRRKDQLQIHLKRHAGEKNFVCEICKSKFASSYRLFYHKNRSKTCENMRLNAALKANKAIEESIDQLYVAETQVQLRNEEIQKISDKDATTKDKGDENILEDIVMEDLAKHEERKEEVQGVDEDKDDKMSLSDLFTIPIVTKE